MTLKLKFIKFNQFEKYAEIKFVFDSEKPIEASLINAIQEHLDSSGYKERKAWVKKDSLYIPVNKIEQLIEIFQKLKSALISLGLSEDCYAEFISQIKLPDQIAKTESSEFKTKMPDSEAQVNLEQKNTSLIEKLYPQALSLLQNVTAHPY